MSKKSKGMQSILVVFLTVVLVFSYVQVGQAQISQGYFHYWDEEVSITVRESDIRDILSLFATQLNRNIIYVGPTFRTSFSVTDVELGLAFEIFLKSTSVDGGSLSFVEKDDLLIVGSTNQLSNNFTEMMVMSTFRLNYMTASELRGHLNTLGVRVTTLTMDRVQNYLIVRGLPYEVAKVNEVIAYLDRVEFYRVDPESGQPTVPKVNLVAYTLRYIQESTARDILSQVGAGGRVISNPNNPDKIWVSGTAAEQVNVADVLRKVDIPENARESDLGIYRLQYVGIDAINQAMEDLGLWQEISVDGTTTTRFIPSTLLVRNPYTILINFDNINREMFEFILEYIDTPSNMQQNPTTFIHKFNNITAQTAMARISEFSNHQYFEDTKVEFRELSYSGLSYQLMVFCTRSEEAGVRNFLRELDVQSEVHKIVVDRSEDVARLISRIPMISYLSGIPEERFYTTGNMSQGAGTTQYLTILEDNLENVDKVLSVIHMIDNAKDRSVDIE